MKKIPTIFERDWDGDPSRVLTQPAEGCEWVFAGEGVATRKYDGTSCMIKDGILYKRMSISEGKSEPPGIFVATETVPGKPSKTILWVEVGDGPEDKWHREALERAASFVLIDGTYELVGPKVQGNPERFDHHVLVYHQLAETYIVPRTFNEIRDLLTGLDVEGFVFQHEDGRMGKIKCRDFGIKRTGQSENVMAKGAVH